MNKKTIYLSGSAFWGGQAFLDRLPGVLDTELGLTDVDAGTVVETFFLAYPDSEYLGTSECIKVDYDADVIPLTTLLEAFFLTVDPFSTAKQISYTQGMPQAKVYFVDPSESGVIDAAIAGLQQNFDRAVTIKCVPLEGFTPAGKYAQDYIDRNLGETMMIDPSLADAFAESHADEFGNA